MGLGGSIGGVVTMGFCGWKLRVVPREATDQQGRALEKEFHFSTHTDL